MERFIETISKANLAYLRIEAGFAITETGYITEITVLDEYNTVTVSDGSSEIKLDFSYPYTLTEVNGELLYRFANANVILYYMVCTPWYEED